MSDLDATLCSRRFDSYYTYREELPAHVAVRMVEQDGCDCCAKRGARYLDPITQLGRLASA